jgi:hypothetical protein
MLTKIVDVFFLLELRLIEPSGEGTWRIPSITFIIGRGWSLGGP